MFLFFDFVLLKLGFIMFAILGKFLTVIKKQGFFFPF